MAWTKREVLAYLDRVEPVLTTLDHFELLDVHADAGPLTVQEAFHAMASNLHPDLYRRELEPANLERLTIVYARIAEAYRVLRHAGHRRTYLKDEARKMNDQRAATAEPTAASRSMAVARLSPKAQRLYRRAQTSMRMHDMVSAKLNLRMALAIDPKSALLREALADLEANLRADPEEE